jgi:hypothetical protein
MKQETLLGLTSRFRAVKSRPGRNGQSLQYLEGHQIIERLNEVFEGEWSFAIVEHHILDTGVMVLGKLEAGDMSKMAFGGSDVTRARDTGEPINLADDLKAAATDSLKKASTLLGVGLYLYGNDTDDAEGSKGNGAPKGNGSSNGNGSGENGNGSRLSRKQLAYIYRLAREQGLARGEVEELARGSFGKTSAFLSMHEASDFIQTLQQPGG